MPVAAKTFLVCDYAALNGNKPTVVGLFELLFTNKQAFGPIPIPRHFLFAWLECPTNEGAQHGVSFRCVDADGHEVASFCEGHVQRFTAGIPNRGLSACVVLDVGMLQVPDYGDYSYEVLADGVRVGSAPLSVLPLSAAIRV